MAEEEKKEVKKLDDIKDSEENKKAIAESEGKPVEKKSEPAVAKTPKKEKKEEVKVELEREYIVPLKKGVLNVPQYRRAKKAIRVLKEFIAKHMQVRDRDLRKIKIDIFLNNELWFRGIKKPANKIKVKAKKIGELVYVELAEPAQAVKYLMARAEKKSLAATATPEKTPKAKEEPEEDKDKDGVADKIEEKEDIKAGTEAKAKIEKKAAKDTQHTTKGAHAKKSAPVRKVMR